MESTPLHKIVAQKLSRMSDRGLRSLAQAVLYELRSRGDMECLAEIVTGAQLLLDLPQRALDGHKESENGK